MAVDSSTYFVLAVALPLLAGFLVALTVLWRTKRSALVVIATAALLLILFGPLSLAGALLGAAAWLSTPARMKRRGSRPAR